MSKIGTCFFAVVIATLFTTASQAATWIRIGNGCTIKQQTFNASGTFWPSAALLARGGWIEVLAVGGGGGGGGQAGEQGLGGEIVNRMVQISGGVGVTVGDGSTYGWPSAGTSSKFGAYLTAFGGNVVQHSVDNMSSIGLGWTSSRSLSYFSIPNTGGGSTFHGGSGVVIVTYCE